MKMDQTGKLYNSLSTMFLISSIFVESKLSTFALGNIVSILLKDDIGNSISAKSVRILLVKSKLKEEAKLIYLMFAESFLFNSDKPICTFFTPEHNSRLHLQINNTSHAHTSQNTESHHRPSYITNTLTTW